MYFSKIEVLLSSILKTSELFIVLTSGANDDDVVNGGGRLNKFIRKWNKFGQNLKSKNLV